MEAFGAKVLVEKSTDGTISPDLIQRMKSRAYSLASEPGCFYVDQFGSPDVRKGYEPMGLEIATDLAEHVDVLISAVGTGGALLGTMDGLEKAGVLPKVIALEPLQSPLLTTGKGGPHKIEGIGVGFEPPFLDRARVSDIRAIYQVEAFSMCRRLASETGIFCGASTGLNIAGAIDLARELDPSCRIVTLGCDNGTKYLAGDIY